MTVQVLVLAVALASEQAPPQKSTTDVPVIASAAADQRQRMEPREKLSEERPHTVGLGGQLAISNRGAGAGARFFFGDRLGVNLNAFWYRPSTRYSVPGNEPGATYGAFPSFIYMLTKAGGDRDVDIRPYVGAGMSYVSGTRNVASGNTVIRQRVGGAGGQVFGGVEMTFSGADFMTLSAEGVYYRLPVRFVNSSVVDGFNYLVAVHFYMK